METKAINTKLKGHARVDVADVLRGLAVMGIIILHSIEHFNFYSFPDTAGQSAWLNFSDKAIWNGLFFMFGGKAYAIFALLFGFSFFIQDDNQRLRGNDFRLRFCWRLILLFLIGNINASFFIILDAAMALFDRIVNPALLVRRVNIVALHILVGQEELPVPEVEQLDLFTDYAKLEQERLAEQARLERESRIQQAALSIKRKFGKNALVKGMDLQEDATAMTRNNQIGGHKA